MGDAPTWIVHTSDLEVGTTLSFDLTDSNGVVLHKAGMQISDRLKDRLQKMNILSVTVRGEPTLGKEGVEAILLNSYPAATTKAILGSIDTARRAVRQFADSLVKNHNADASVLRSNVNQFAIQAKENVSAALAAISLQSQFDNASILERISDRSTKASLMGVAMSVTNKDKLEMTLDIGVAGLLHDCSLLLHPNWFSLSSGLREEAFLNEYRRHPLESAELLHGTPGMSRNAITIITQVHEQADGSGYPRGLLSSQSLPGSTILNMVDAYLNLTMPLQGEAIIPADAMAYLCHHVSLGHFCREAYQLMLQSMSIYPVGSIVKLDDNSVGVVIQGNPGFPLQPIVRLLHAGQSVVNLRESKRGIAEPWMLQADRGTHRIQKPQLQQVLWRTDV